MKKPKTTPQLRFPGFEEELKQQYLHEFTDLITKGTTPKYFVTNGIKYIKIECFQENKIINDRCLFIDEKTHSTDLSRSILKCGDILFAIAGATIGKCGIVENGNLPANTNQALAIIRLKNTEYISYMSYVLVSHVMQKYIYNNIAVGAQPNLNLEQINYFSFHLPPLPEQQKIAAFLTAVDERIRQLTRKKELLEKYKKGVMQKIFSRKIRFKDENGRTFPEWKYKKLHEVLNEHCLLSTGKEEVFSVSVHKGVVNQIEHLGRSFSASSTDHYNLVKPNDIVYTKSPTGNFPYGIIKQSKQQTNVIVSPLYGVFTPETPYLGYMLDAYFESNINTYNYLSPIVQKGAKNTINITNQTFLSRSLVLPVSHAEQEKIYHFIKSISDRISILNFLIDKTTCWKKGLLQKMFV